MKQLITGLALFCSLSGFGQKVYINQVFYDTPLEENKMLPPYQAHNNGEFIELKNPSNSPADVSGWCLCGDGMKESFRLPSGAVIPPQSCMIVAYRYAYGTFHLSELFPDIEEYETAGMVVYQNNIILSNSGEQIILLDKNNTVVDRMFYNGTTSGPLFARNGFGRKNINCLSLHRSNVSRDANGNGTFVVSDWRRGLVTPFGKPVTTVVPEPQEPDINLFSDQNYILTRTYTTEDGNNYLDAIQYFDGLGRPVETVQAGVTPNHNDLVAYQDYDAFGRESNSWLPAVAYGNNGAYIPAADYRGKAMATYNSAAFNAAADSVPYNRPVYEPSPLNRVVEQYGAGQDWQKNGKSVKTDYLTNDAAGCAIYAVTADGKLNKKGNYQASQLYVTKTTDEDGNVSYEFKDKLGQVVLTRQVNDNQNHDTYFVYDDFGKVRFVLPPSASDLLPANTTWDFNNQVLMNYAYMYKYDGQLRCIAKKLPGADWIYNVYDSADRLIFAQDGENRKQGEWQFSIPDALGRVVLTGICKNSINYDSDKPLGDAVVKAAYNAKRTAIADSYIITGITLSDMQILSANYYDSYDFMGIPEVPDNDDTQYNGETGYNTWNRNSFKTLLTGTVTALLNPDGTISPDYLYSIMYYDFQKRVIQTKSNSPLADGLEKEYIAYNFTGQPVQKKHIHSATGKAAQTEIYAYTYDDAGRLTKETHQLNGGTVTAIAENTYDELGRLKTDKKGGLDSLSSTFSYNIRSWVKAIINPLFSETLYYNESCGGSAKRYNGNLSAMDWKVSGETITRGYAFSYNNLSWLTGANYLENGAANGRYSSSYSYDKQGNIETLNRYGRINANALGKIDSLTIDYTGNQLKKIKDRALNANFNGSMDFKDYANEDVEYEYNANGAMTKDLNKGIQNIQYNLLNLPRLMDIKSPVAEARNEYTYSAAGAKLRVVQRWNPNYSTMPVTGSAVNVSSLLIDKTTDYIGNMIYEDDTLKRILIDGGYIEDGMYYYYLTDHLGNNRVVADANGEMVQKNHYYPFGMSFAETSVEEQGKQPYKYGGKELDQMNGLNLYDNLARFYDPAFPRTLTMDQLCEKYYPISPYSWCNNSPVRLIDPTGLAWRPTYDEDSNGNKKCNGYEWVDENESYDIEGNLLPGLYSQAIFFSNNGTYNSNSKYNIGSSTATVYLADGTTQTFDADTNPSSSDYPTVPEGIYYAKVGMHNGSQGSYIALKMRDVGASLNIIELGGANPAHPERTYAKGIDIHKDGYKDLTGMTKAGRPVSAGCLLIKRDSWSDFIGIFDTNEQRANTISVTVSRSMATPVNINRPPAFNFFMSGTKYDFFNFF